MSEYKYKCPTEYGYQKVKVSRHEYKKHFINRKINIFSSFEIYIDASHDQGRIDKFINPLGIIAVTLLFPIYAIFVGIDGFKDLKREYSSMFNQKEKGSFNSDNFQLSRYDLKYKIIS